MNNRLLRFASVIVLILVCAPHTVFTWQQHVHYTMDIQLDAATHSYRGMQSLILYNNSPDTLREAYYHLYYNAFKPGSMMDVRDRELGGGLRISDLSPSEQGNVEVEAMKQDGEIIRWKTDETILHVWLAKPLLPNDSTVITMKWATQIPRLRRRGGWMSSQGVEFSMAQWYPKLCMYDRNGWHYHEYVSREFYGVFGTFDVNITAPASYVLGGTGVIQNPMEVGCGYELNALQDTLVEYPVRRVAGSKTWKFHAENVHDFAWVADREYAHGISHWENVPLHFLFKRNSGNDWEDEAYWTRNCIAYYSRRFGRYLWPQFTVSVAGDGGMEYPMLIMITGYRPGVTAHEIGHQWYYGMMGNNETQEAYLDEGFTQFLTDEAMRDTVQMRRTRNPYSGLDRIVYPWSNSPWLGTYNYYQLAATGYEEPLTTFHDWFREGVTASSVYFKGETMIRMVQYMFGDSLFDVAMHHYYDKWYFDHPSGRDFERAMEEASGMRLDWFFSQWIGTVKTCDYALDGISSEQVPEGGYNTTVRVSNRSEAVMPIDITLRYEDGSTATANIPQEDWTKPNTTFILPRWRWVAPDYTTTFKTPKRVVSAEIDTTMLLADIDRTNNVAYTSVLGNLVGSAEFAWYKRWDMLRPMEHYTYRLRPTLWYSKGDGMQLGLTADGGYAFDRYNSKLGIYYNMESKRIDYNVRVSFPTTSLMGRLSDATLFATNSDGVEAVGVTLNKTIKPFNFAVNGSESVSIRATHERLLAGNYPNALMHWDSGNYNTLELGYSGRFSINKSFMRSISLNVGFDASFASTMDFTQWRVASRSVWNIFGVGMTLDVFAGSSTGQIPLQRMFNAAGATARDMHNNLIQRLVTNIEPEYMLRNHLLLPTQGFIYSYAGVSDSVRYGEHLFNLQLGTGNISPFSTLMKIPVLNQITMQLYGSGGWNFRHIVTMDGFSHFNYEIGAVAGVDIMRLLLPDVLNDAIDAPSPLRIALIVPFYTQNEYLMKNGFGYRWAIGVSL